MAVVVGMLLGVALTVSALALLRLARHERRLLEPGDEAMREALHHAAAMLPDLRRGLSVRTAQRSVRHVRALAQAPAVVLADAERVLAVDGDAPLRPGDPLPAAVAGAAAARVEVLPDADLELAAPGSPSAAPPAQAGEPPPDAGSSGRPAGERSPDAGSSDRPAGERSPDAPRHAVVLVPLRVGEERAGTLLALFPPGRVRAEDARVVTETGSLVSAQLGLSVLAEREERAATAELRALRAQISPHFVYNAMAAIASLIHTAPDEARELLTEFAAFTRYAFREQRSYVTLADELHYVEKYLRLEQARFRERLKVRVEVAPEALPVAVPVLSLQPLVENAVRHGVEQRADGGVGTVTITGRDVDRDVELRITDDGPGVDADVARSALEGTGRGGIGLRNVDVRLRASFGEGYGLRVSGDPAAGTTVTMTVPKFRAEVRARMSAEEAR